MNDCLVPWVPTSPAVVNYGATFAAGLGLQFVASESDYLDTGYNPSTLAGAKHTLNSASFAVLVTEAPANNQYLFGTNGAGGGTTNLVRSGATGANHILKINTTDIVTDQGSGGMTGVFVGNRPSATSLRLLLDGALIEEETNNAPTALNNGVFTIARQGSATPVYSDMKVAGWAIGAGLTPQEEIDLSAIMKRIWNALK